METLRFYLFSLLCYYLSSKSVQLLTVVLSDNIIPAPSVGSYSIESGALSSRLISGDVSNKLIIKNKQAQENIAQLRKIQDQLMGLEDALVKRRKQWVYVLKGILILNVIWQASNLLAVLISINGGPEKPQVSDLQSNNIFLMLRVCGHVSTLIFLTAAIVLHCQMKALINQDQIKYDNKIKEAQDLSLKKLLELIKWALLITVTLLIFDVVQFSVTDRITWRLISSPLWLNDFIIVVMRFIAYMIWAIPVFTLFWPQIVTSKRRQELLSENKNKRTIAGHSLPSGLLSQSVALDEDQDNKMKFIK